ncbi:hypothetical protein SV7mr_39850 [Stieleria bergensis]|uniref:Uncharacterized protein n=2 Tax=Stieleria bergensis TaxID=2528025 RepID=A0A517SZ78_9BACT|nr:hypothetical protein SV7mr_39850 [Planctomycetes bacterium SV_7m_r]
MNAFHFPLVASILFLGLATQARHLATAQQPQLVEAPVMDVADEEIQTPAPQWGSSPLVTPRDIRHFTSTNVIQEESSSPESDWLDIRPRSIDGETNGLVTKNLPQDRSGMPEGMLHGMPTRTYRTELTMSSYWHGARFCHRPLRFEDPALERYGRCGEGYLGHFPVLRSTGLFMAQSALLPVGLALKPPNKHVWSGPHRPILYWLE